jgi:hypothetical protein
MACLWLGYASASVSEGFQIDPGLWQFSAERHTEVRVFGIKKHSQHQSQRCLSADPLTEIVAELERKGCRTHSRVAKGGEVALSGVCEFTFLPGQELPMSGALQRLGATQMTLTLNAGRPGLSYRETASVTRVAACPERP